MPLTKQQVREAFDLFDNDMSGYITADEIKIVFKGLGLEEDLMKEADTDGDNKISFEEFWSLMQKQQKEAEGPREILAAFRAFNPSNTGEISKDDLREVAHSIGEAVTDQDIEEIWQFCADNDVDEEGTSHFSFTAWRTVIESVYNRRTSRGNDEIYNDENMRKLPDHDDAIWADLETEEMELRDMRAEERHEKDKAQLDRQGRLEAVRLQREHEEEQPKPEAPVPSATSRWRQQQSMQDVVKESMAKRKDVLQKQKQEERERAVKEAEEKARVIAKIQERRKRAESQPQAAEEPAPKDDAEYY